MKSRRSIGRAVFDLPQGKAGLRTSNWQGISQREPEPLHNPLLADLRPESVLGSFSDLGTRYCDVRPAPMSRHHQLKR
jgi:hypothetical protein